MKKVIIVILILIIVVIGVKLIYPTNEKNIDINIQQLGQELIATQIFEDNLNEIDKDIILKRWNFDSEKIKNAASYVGTGATAEEILILEVVNDKDVKEIEQTIKSKLEERKQDFQSYLPKEVFKLENYILKNNSRYIILCVSNDSNKAEEIINKYVKS